MKPMRKRKDEPGCEGKMELRPAVVVSPYLNADVKGQQTERVQKNIRHDILEREFNSRHISDAQKAAGDAFMATYERAGIGGAKAIDYQTPKVDSMAKGDPLTDGVLAAHQRLKRIQDRIGEDDFRLLVMTICRGRSLRDIAADRYAPYLTANARHESERFVGRRFREALGKLADMDLAKGRERPSHNPDLWERHTPLSGL